LKYGDLLFLQPGTAEPRMGSAIPTVHLIFLLFVT